MCTAVAFTANWQVYTQDAGLTRSDGRKSKAAAAAAAAVCSSDSSMSVDDDVGRASLLPADFGSSSRPPTTFQERVASAKLAASSKRSTPASRLARRQDSLTTLDPDRLASLLGGSRTRLCGVDARTSSDAYSDVDEDAAAKTTTRSRARTKRRSRRTAATELLTSSDEEDLVTSDAEKRSKRRLRVDVEGRDDDEMKRLASSSKASDDRKKRERDGRNGHRQTTIKDAAGEQSTRTTRSRRDVVPVFNLGEYPATSRTGASPRLDAIKRSVERAHKNRRKSSPAPARDGADRRRRGRGGAEQQPGARTTLKTNALLSQSQFVKLKVLPGDLGLTCTSSVHRRHPSSCHCRRWCSRRVTVALRVLCRTHTRLLCSLFLTRLPYLDFFSASTHAF